MPDQKEFVAIMTDRLVIRRLELADADAVWRYKQMPEAVQYQSWRPVSLEEVQSFILRNQRVAPNAPGEWLQVAVCLKDSGELIGDTGLHFLDDSAQAEIGYTISPMHQRRGYGTEAVRAVLGYLFAGLGKHRVTASIDPRNTPSAAVLEKLGFRKEAHFRMSFFIDGEWQDDCVYGLLREEWH
jgi:RimJ/RimL family protein N-acetyltransferase